jgi:hypothetical protein
MTENVESASRATSTLQKNAEILHVLYGLLDSDREPTDSDAQMRRVYVYYTRVPNFMILIYVRSLFAAPCAPPGNRGAVGEDPRVCPHTFFY